MRIVGGVWSGRQIAAPPGRDTRPTTDRVREAWMSAVAPWLADASVLDLFAGSGALGLEALSRGASRAVFVETGGKALQSLRANLASLEVNTSSTSVLPVDAIRHVASLRPFEYDLAFADPPYEQGFATRLVELWSASPFARILCIEHSPHERLGGVTPAREKRYGDTMLTFLMADPEVDPDLTTHGAHER
ncbi:MAG: 16S rRNA (guanine(966)-N(2))-methyltransferase RsmD [Gemmatimonadota bacterium]|jgi:16S rRNA (guanine966-N2)-methyltransferase|nr:16S rRNA (guanine(966)-N(2))-methyltransferase RsmD [Gemmatimonadota bacterium]